MNIMLQWYLQDRGASNTKVVNLRKILIYSAICLPVLILIISLAGILHRTGKIEDRLIAEFNSSTEELEILKKNLLRMGSDINQTRNLIGLPETEYNYNKKEDNTDKSAVSEEKSENHTIYYRGFELLKTHYRETELLKKLSYLTADKNLLNTVQSKSLVINEKNNFYIISDSKNSYYKLSADIVQNNILISPQFTIIGEGKFTNPSADEISLYINDSFQLIKDNYLKLDQNIKYVQSLLNDTVLKSYFRKNKLYFDNYNTESEQISVDVNRESGITVAQIVLSKKENNYTFCGNTYSDFNNLRNDLMNISNICDIRTFDEKKIEKSKNDLNLLTEDESFINYLSDNGYIISDSVREDNDYYYFDILKNSDRQIIGSFAVHKVSGEIYLTDHEEIPLSSLNTFTTLSKKKK